MICLNQETNSQDGTGQKTEDGGRSCDHAQSGKHQTVQKPSQLTHCCKDENNGSNCSCVDYRQLNDIMRRDAFPTPRIKLTLEAGASCFPTLHLASVNWQVYMDPKDIPQMAFLTANSGLYEHIGLPFGLYDASATFQRLMNDLYEKSLNKTVIVFLDYVLLLCRSTEVHTSYFKLTFQYFREANLKLNPRNIIFYSGKSPTWVTS